MSYLPYLIAGLVTGSVYGLAGTGLVLTYKTSGVFNLAHGALATVSAYAFYELKVVHQMPWGLAAGLCVFVGGPVLGLLLEVLARSLSGAGLAVKVASTVGLLLVVQSLVALRYDAAKTLVVPQYLPEQSFTIGSAPVSAAQVIVVAVPLLSTVGLLLFFRFARLGVAMRAVVDDPALLDSAGTSPTYVRRVAWVIGVTFASLSGVLLAPLLAQLNALNLTFLVVTAFGAAAIGAFSNLPLTYLGGLGIGVAQQLCSRFFTTGVLTGLNPALPFLVLFVVLLVFPRRKLAARVVVAPRRRGPALPWKVQAGGAGALLAFLLLVPGIDRLHLTDWTNGLAYVIVFLALGLLVRTSGQVSLCHISFVAIGACAMSDLNVRHHVPWGVALLLAGLVAVPIGAVLAVPAIRLSGLYLALATFGFGISLQYMLYTESFMFGSDGLGRTLQRPHLSWLTIDSDRGYYYLVLALAALTALGVVLINHNRLGRLLRALADSPTGLATSGTSVNVTRVLVFCVSAFLASAAGALQAVSVQQISGDAYSPLTSLVLFAIVIISIGSEPWYAVLAAFGFVIIPVLPHLAGPHTATWLQLLFGIAAVAHAYGDRPAEALATRLVRHPQPEPAAPAVESVRHLPPRVPSGCLELDAVTVAFGGVVAVNGVSLSAPTGRITGLVGPNGAGKTTTFNAASGLNGPTSGVVRLHGTDVTRLGPAARARRGLGRTFQRMELFESMTVHDNVALGAEAPLAGLNALGHLICSPDQNQRIRERAKDAIVLCGLQDLAGRTVGSLSTGQQRLVELARCLAGDARVLLLDEPSSGLDRAETLRFGDVLLQAVAERGVGVLLVEHDMSLVARVCEYIYVLDFGVPLFEGSTRDVLASPLVQAAYLGGDEVEDFLDGGLKAAGLGASP